MPITSVRTANVQTGLRYFTFSLKNTRYIVMFDQDCPRTFDCRECSWNLWHGYRQEEYCASRTAHYVAGRIIRQGLLSGKDCFTGEDYATELEGTPCKGRLHVRRTGKRFFTEIKRIAPILIRFTVQMLMCMVSWSLLIDDVVPWVQSILKCNDTTLLRVLLMAAGFGCSALMFVLDRSSRRLFVYAIQALLPIGAVYVLGILWVYHGARIAALIAIPVAIVVAFLWHRFMLEDDFPFAIAGFCRTMAVVLCLTAIVPMLYLPLRPVVLDTPAVIADQGDREEILLRNLEAREHLEYWDWMALTTEKKLEYAQSIADYECVYTLGIAPVAVCTAIISDPDVRGTYSDSDGLVTIQYDVLCHESPGVVLEVVLHEVRHAYQYRVVDMYEALLAQGGIPEEYRSLAAIQTVESFYKEHLDYCSSEQNFDQYYDQVVEQDSRRFASQRIRESYAVDLGR